VGIVDRSGVSKVGKSLARLGTTEQYSVGTLGGAKGQLIKGNALAAGSLDTLASILRKAQCTYGQLGALEHANIVRHLADNHGSLAILLGHVFRETVQTNRGLVHLAHVQTLQDSRAEFRVRTAAQEFVKLDEQLVVGVVRLDKLH